MKDEKLNYLLSGVFVNAELIMSNLDYLQDRYSIQ